MRDVGLVKKRICTDGAQKDRQQGLHRLTGTYSLGHGAVRTDRSQGTDRFQVLHRCKTETDPRQRREGVAGEYDGYDEEELVIQCGESVSFGKTLKDLGFTLIGTQGTADFYNSNGIKCDVVNKIGAGRPDVVDLIMNKDVCLVINTPKAKRNYAEDRKTIRKMCLKYKVHPTFEDICLKPTPRTRSSRGSSPFLFEQLVPT